MIYIYDYYCYIAISSFSVNQQQRQQGVPAHVPPPSSYRPEVHEPRLETHGPAAASVERLLDALENTISLESSRK